MKILLPLDDSECSVKTMSWVNGFFKGDQRKHLKLYLIHVIPVAMYPPELVYPYLAEEHPEQTMTLLQNAAAQLREQGFEVDETYYATGDIPLEICRYAAEKQVDHIILGSHARKGLAKAILGSVSEEVFRQADRSVIICSNTDHPSLEVNHLDGMCLTESI